MSSSSPKDPSSAEQKTERDIPATSGPASAADTPQEEVKKNVEEEAKEDIRIHGGMSRELWERILAAKTDEDYDALGASVKVEGRAPNPNTRTRIPDTFTPWTDEEKAAWGKCYGSRPPQPYKRWYDKSVADSHEHQLKDDDGEN
ncbi:hypothetical protein TWF696_001920 [Orbilia brochopaga]|uniref:Uncharacterized protein n=1 Tax=Orbilia brochopaga TaxID=3140254 RepID=A0AAV9U992_9PEZI